MPESTRIIAASLLDTWISCDWRNGLQLASMDDLTEILVRTRNSVYEITVIDGRAAEILVRGGRFFLDRTPAYLEGSSHRGSFLKSRGIYVGFNLEIVAGGTKIVTSTVLSAETRPPHP
jgi:hypothetical protein